MKKTLLTITTILTVSFTFAQGCSDAGICTIGHGFQSDEKELKNSLEIATVFGAGEGNVTYFSPYVSYSRKINDKFSLSAKVTFSSAKGDFGTLSSFGDAFIAGNYTFAIKDKTQWSALVGWKIPFNNSNLKLNGTSLPLDYQASLGTHDLFLGTNYKNHNLDFNLAVQIPIINNNTNSYFKETSGSLVFPSTNLFERKADALFRATYTLETKNQKFTFKPNVLFIYHLGDDSFENAAKNRETIVGSKGLTINGNLVSSYHISKQKSVELSIASPFKIRDIRPDGLTRSFVLALQYHYSF